MSRDARTHARRPRPNVAGTLLQVAAGALLVAGPTHAQEPAADTTPARPVARTGGWGAADAAWRPGSTVASVTVAFPRGSSDDPEDAPGATWLLGRVVHELLFEALPPGPRETTELAVEVDRSRTVFRMVTLPSHFEEAYRALERALLRAEPTDAAVAAARADMEEVFAFEQDAPHREFEVELYRFLSGVGSPWSRPRMGTAESVEPLAAADLASLRERAFRKADGVVSVVGAVPSAEAARVVTEGPALPREGTAAADFAPLAERTSGPDVWGAEDRLVRTVEVTSTWIAVAWPVGRETSRTALEMLVHRLDGRFNPSPPDPGAFHVDVRLELLGSHDLLVVEAAVLPEAAPQWERRIRSAVDEIAAREMDGPFFRAYRRRFRGSRLVRDAPPEVESLRRALDLLLRGRVRDLPERIGGLDPGALRDAAADLGPPRILLFGPDLTDRSSW